MHQTFYIDVDEEISSVIDRLNKSMSLDNYFVVPKRALFLQSIVNLKILKREADKMSKRVFIVTQDEMVISMAERCGIEIKESLDPIESADETYSDDVEEETEYEQDIEESFEQKKYAEEDKQARLKNIGSGEYYRADHGMDIRRGAQEQESKHASTRASKAASKKIISRPQKIVLKKVAKTPPHKEAVVVNGIRHAKTVKGHPVKNSFKGDLDPQKAQTLEKLFSANESRPVGKHDKIEEKKIGNGKVKNVFAFFMVLCLLVFAGVAAYLFLPSAKVNIATEFKEKKVDMEITATNENVADAKNIPIKVIEKEDQSSFSYPIKGTSKAAGKKARGKVIIYNEYSNESQTLIATTRLEAENGKIFRLVKNVVVPGSSNVGGQTKAGAIQAEIIADQAGEDYNLESSKFTIPGFSGGPKFDKFYAMSDSAITGGSGGGEGTQSAGQVTQSDLDSAKQKAEAAFKEKILQSATAELSSSEISLSQAQKVTITKSSASAKVGTLTDSLQWEMSGSVKLLVFSENDVKKLVLESARDQQTSSLKYEILKIDYGSVEPDFDKPSMKVRIYAQVAESTMVDTEKIKKEILGKNDTQLKDILRKYTFIKSANVEFSPSFITRIPSYSSRVDVEVTNEAQ